MPTIGVGCAAYVCWSCNLKSVFSVIRQAASARAMDGE